MARTETILRVFVASPSDIREERQILNDVIQELNNTWSKTLKIRLEFIGWETHSYPNFGEDAQAVINEEVDDEYDIFVGIMWSKFGTATKRAGSGTEEEFYRAYERHKKSPDEIKIMFYFKDAPIAPSELNPEQLHSIQKFKTELGEKGGYYWTFTDREEFSQLLRLHLSRQVQNWREESLQENVKIVPVITDDESDPVSVDTLEDDEGFLDLLENSQNSLETMNEAILRIGSATGELTEKLNINTEELKKNNSLRDAKRIANRVADALTNFSALMEVEVPIFAESYSSSMDSFSRAFSLLEDFGDIDEEQIRTVEMQINNFQSTITEARISTLR